MVSFTVMRNRKQSTGLDHEDELPAESNTFVNNVTPKSDALDSWGLPRPLVALLLEESSPAAGFSRVLGTQPELVRAGLSQGLYS